MESSGIVRRILEGIWTQGSVFDNISTENEALYPIESGG